jgi:hypothetical protein
MPTSIADNSGFPEHTLDNALLRPSVMSAALNLMLNCMLMKTRAAKVKMRINNVKSI